MNVHYKKKEKKKNKEKNNIINVKDNNNINMQKNMVKIVKIIENKKDRIWNHKVVILM